jgi:hypothetical protein
MDTDTPKATTIEDVATTGEIKIGEIEIGEINAVQINTVEINASSGTDVRCRLAVHPSRAPIARTTLDVWMELTLVPHPQVNCRLTGRARP